VVGRDLFLEVDAEQSQEPAHDGRQSRLDPPDLPAQQLLARGGTHRQQHDTGDGRLAPGERRGEDRALAMPGQRQPVLVDLRPRGQGFQRPSEVVDVVVQPGCPPVAGALTDPRLSKR
jgi:hypothetical protein